jgi:hypothetical protein
MKDTFAPMVKHSVPPVSRTAANEKGENHNYTPPPPLPLSRRAQA